MSTREPQPAEGLSVEELSSRLEALEQENSVLRQQVTEQSAPAVGGAVPAAEPRARSHRGRGFASVVLILLGVLLAPVAVVAHWAQAELTDTDRYLATVGPLASDPVIQSAIANRLTTEVMDRIDVSTLVNDAVTGLGSQGLPPRATEALTALQVPIANGVQSFVHNAATKVVESDAFTTAWIDANRVAHTGLIAVMQGTPGSMLQIGSQGQLTIQLSGMIDALKTELVSSGFGIAANIPTVNASFTLVQTTQLVKMQNAYNLLVVLGTWLPWISLGLIAAGVLTAVRRSRALVFAGLAVAISMLVLGLALYFGRVFYLGALTGKVERLDAAQIVFNQIVGFIRVALRTVAVAGLVVALAGYFGGGSDSARSMRVGISRGFSSARGWAEGRGVTAGPVGTWLYRYKAFVRVVVISLAGLAIVLAASPTPALVVTVAVVAAVLIAIVELIARPGAPAPDVPDRASSGAIAGEDGGGQAA